jgi:hypothetical protein
VPHGPDFQDRLGGRRDPYIATSRRDVVPRQSGQQGGACVHHLHRSGIVSVELGDRADGATAAVVILRVGEPEPDRGQLLANLGLVVEGEGLLDDEVKRAGAR